MISTYIRRLRLGSELRAMRTAAGLTHEEIAHRIGVSRAQVSRLENGHLVDQRHVMLILDALGIGGERWTQVINIAREAGEQGWWESVRGLGEKQALRANLEAGAGSIREYQQALVPDLLQMADFARARLNADTGLVPADSTADATLAGQAGRQRMLSRPGAPRYEAVVEEVVIRRLSAPPTTTAKQLRHLVAACDGQASIGLRVLPTDARIDGFAIPCCSFRLYSYPDPGDLAIAVIDTVPSDLVVTEPAQVERYDQLYVRLSDAALSPEQSRDLIIEAAGALGGD